jgi:hypothetical protein
MEVDPSDDHVMFIDLDVVFEVLTLNDVYVVLNGLRRVAEDFYKDRGFIAYPIVRFDGRPLGR